MSAANALGFECVRSFTHVCGIPLAPQIQGYRVRLHFDGYPECYDFWANADSWDLKPAGWCEKNGHKLLLPKGSCKQCFTHSHRLGRLVWEKILTVKSLVCLLVGCKDGEFNWNMYVKNCRGQLAPKHLFKSLNTVSSEQTFHLFFLLSLYLFIFQYIFCYFYLCRNIQLIHSLVLWWLI